MKAQDHWQDGTYEAVRPKGRVNPDRLASHILIQHRSEVVHPRTFEELKTWFAAHEIEGIVWHHKDGRMAKIAADFGYPWGAKETFACHTPFRDPRCAQWYAAYPRKKAPGTLSAHGRSWTPTLRTRPFVPLRASRSSGCDDCWTGTISATVHTPRAT